MKVVVVYELVPERTDIHIVEMTQDEFASVKASHHQFINTKFDRDGAEQACDAMTQLLEGRKPIDSAEPISIQGCEALIITGFIL